MNEQSRADDPRMAEFDELFEELEACYDVREDRADALDRFAALRI